MTLGESQTAATFPTKPQIYTSFFLCNSIERTGALCLTCVQNVCNIFSSVCRDIFKRSNSAPRGCISFELYFRWKENIYPRCRHNFSWLWRRITPPKFGRILVKNIGRISDFFLYRSVHSKNETPVLGISIPGLRLWNQNGASTRVV